MRRDGLLLSGVVLLLLLLAAPVLTYPLGRDQGEFAIIASGILRGAVPYVDLWNPKPPAIFYTYAAAIRLFGQNALAIRALDLLLFPVIAAALFAIGKRLGGRAIGLWSVMIYGVFYFTETFWTLSQNDGIATVPMALAVWCVFVLLDDAPVISPQRKWMLSAVCGALCALTLWFKYPFIAFVIALVIGYLIVRRQWIWAEVGAFVGGGLLVGLGGMAYLWANGALIAWIESARVTAGYTAQGYDFAVFRADMLNYIGYRWRHWHLVWVLAALWLPLRRWLPQTGQPSRWRIIWVWLAGATVAMLMQAKGYDYHWLPMLPPLALLSASTLQYLIQRLADVKIPRWNYAVLAINAGLVLSAILIVQTWGPASGYIIGAQTREDYYANFVGGEFVASESAAMVAYLQENVPPDETLFIWGFRPEVYYLSNLRPASRFIFQFPLVGEWYPSAWQQQTVDTLWGTLPPYVLVVRGDFMPWVTGADADSNMLLQDFTELNNWLMFNYERETEIGNFLVWKRQSG